MAKLIVKSWGDFQHYTKRNPPWIKLHKRLLDNYDYHALPDASKALAPFLWLLASESDDGSIEYAPKKLCFRLHVDEEKLIGAIKPLIEAGFFECDEDASDMLALRYSGPHLETEEEAETKTEKEERRSAVASLDADFSEWYSTYPVHKGRGQAFKAYRLARKKASAEVLLAGAKRYAADPKRDDKFTKHAATWLNSECWLDETQSAPAAKAVDPDAALKADAFKVNKCMTNLARVSDSTIMKLLEAGLTDEVRARAYGWVPKAELMDPAFLKRTA